MTSGRHWGSRQIPRPVEGVRWEVTAHREVVAFRAVDRLVESRNELDFEVETEANLSLSGEGPYVGFLAERDAIQSGRKLTTATPRGVVEGWSAKSRRNLLRSVAEVSNSGRWVMVTLTCRSEWAATPAGVLLTPWVWRSQLDAWRKRIEHAYRPWKVSGCWKMEVQRRGAPHLHFGMVLPEGVEADDFRRAAAKCWHSIHCHSGTLCGGDCPDVEHASRGVHLDVKFAKRRDTGSRAIARYFASHATWGSKEYQHQRPCDWLRAVAGYLSLFGVVVEDKWQKLADDWERPGRWWGLRQVVREPLLQATDLDHELVAIARLIMRKVVRRRSQRLVYVGGKLWDTLVVTRSMPSLHGAADRGWWSLSNDGPALLRWLLHEAGELRGLTGPALAVGLSLVDLPESEPERLHASRSAWAARSRWEPALVSSDISGG